MDYYLGPAFRVEVSDWGETYQYEVRSCPTVDCRNHMKLGVGDFCSICGTRFKQLMQTGVRNIRSALYDRFGDEYFVPPTEEGDKWYFVSNTGVVGKFDPSEVEVTPETMLLELSVFREKMQPLFNWLEERLGEGRVRLVYCVFRISDFYF